MAFGVLIAAFSTTPASAVTVSYDTRGYLAPGQGYISFGCYSCSKDSLTAYSSSHWVEPGDPANDKLGWLNVVSGTRTVASRVNFTLIVTELQPGKGQQHVHRLLVPIDPVQKWRRPAIALQPGNRRHRYGKV